MVKYKKILLCLIILFISIAGVSASDSNQTSDIIGVSDSDSNQTSDIISVSNEDVLGNGPGTFAEFKSIIDGKESGATIVLEKNYLFSDVTYGINQTGILINKPLTIDGAGFYVDGNNYARIFNITSSDVTLKNIKIVNGYFSDNSVTFGNTERKYPCYGGAIYVSSNVENLKFENVTFKDNNVHADSSSGANRKDGYGGAIYFAKNVKNITFDSCNFTDNNAYGYAAYGATLYFVGYAEDVLFKDSYFYNNTVLHDTSTQFSDNRYAYGTGAAVYMGSNSKNIAFKNGIIFNNSVVNINSNPARDGFYTDDAIYIGSNSNATIENFDLSHSGFQNYGNLTVKNVNFTNKSSITNGGNLIVDKALFANGTDEQSRGGGAIYMNGGTAVIKNAEFINNRAYTLGINFQGSHHAYAGGAIYNGGSGQIEIYNSTFKDNYAKADGGAIYTKGNLSVYNSSFENNYLSYDGGWQPSGYGAAIYLGGSTNEISDCNFTNNYAVYGSGGAIYANNNAVNNTVENCNFINNNVTYVEYDPSVHRRYFANGNGGAIYFSTGSNTISNSYFEGNMAHKGSAIHSEESSLSISDSDFVENKLDNVIVELDTINAYMCVYVYLKAGNTQMDAVYSSNDNVIYSNVIYVDGEGSHNTDIEHPNYNTIISNQNVTLEVWDGDVLIRNSTKLTNEEGFALFDDLNLENDYYDIKAYHLEDEYYAYGETRGYFEKIGDFTALQELIYSTPENGTLNLERNFTFTPGLDDYLVDGIIIDKNITILGNGFTIDGLNQSKIFAVFNDFNIDPYPITLNNLSFVNYIGTALYFNNVDNAVIENCNFINGHPFEDSSIYFNGGNLTLSNCEFINVSTVHNLTKYDSYYDIYYNVLDSKFNAFLYVDSSDNVRISKVKVKDSIWGDNGYCFYIKSNNVTIDNFEFTNNTGIRYIYEYDSSLNTYYLNTIFYGDCGPLFGICSDNFQLLNSNFTDCKLSSVAYVDSNNITVKGLNISNCNLVAPFYFNTYASLPNNDYIQPESQLVFEDVNVVNASSTIWGYRWYSEVNDFRVYAESMPLAFIEAQQDYYYNWSSQDNKYVFANSTETFKNINFTNVTGFSGVISAKYIKNLTIENISIFNMSSTGLKVDYNFIYEKYYEEYNNYRGVIFQIESSNLKLNNVSIDHIGDYHDGYMMALDLDNYGNVTITNFEFKNAIGGEMAMHIGDETYGNNVNGTIIFENVTMNNISSRVNITDYDYDSDEYGWSSRDYSSFMIAMRCENSDIYMSNLTLDNISCNGGDECAVFIIGDAKNVKISNYSLLNSISGNNQEGGFCLYVVSEGNTTLKDINIDNVTCCGTYYSEFYPDWGSYTEISSIDSGGVGIVVNALGNVDVSDVNITNCEGVSYKGILNVFATNISIEKILLENFTIFNSINEYYEFTDTYEYYSYSSVSYPSSLGVFIKSEDGDIQVNDFSIINVQSNVASSLFQIEGNDVTLENVNISNSSSGGIGAISVLKSSNPSNDTIIINNIYMDGVMKSYGENKSWYDDSLGKVIWSYNGLDEGGASVSVSNENANLSASNITIINSEGGGVLGIIDILVNNTDLSNVYINNITIMYEVDIEYDNAWDTYFEKISGVDSSNGAKVNIESKNVDVRNLTVSNSVAGGQDGLNQILYIYSPNVTMDNVNLINISEEPLIVSQFNKQFNMQIVNKYYSDRPKSVLIDSNGKTNTTIIINNFNVDNIPASQYTIKLLSENITITNSTIKNLKSMYVEEQFIEDARDTIPYYSDNMGNGVWIDAVNAVISNTLFDNLTFGGDDASEFGYVLVLYVDNILIDNSSFVDCRADSYNESTFLEWYGGKLYYDSIVRESYGSAICFFGDNNTINDTKFINCSADYGGALYLTKRVNITDCEFTNNSAKVGGAIYVDNDAYEIINKTYFIENKAIDGGAIYFNITSFNNVIYNSSFIKNLASHNGGALYIIASNQNNANIINQSIFDHNHADYVGGAFYFNDTQNRMLFEDYEFFNRSALYSDGPLEFVGYNTKILNSLYELNTDYALVIEANDTGYGKNSTVIIRIRDDAKGYVFVNITDEKGNIINDVNGSPVNGEYLLKDGMVELQLGVLPVGKYNVTAHYDDYEYNEPGDEYVYHINSTVFSVINHFLNVYANSSIYTDQNITVEAKLNDYTNGEIVFKFNETFEYRMNVTNGTAIANIGGFYAGNYTVNVTYLDDGVFYEISNSTNFTVISRDSFVNVTAQNITYGKNATIIVRVPAGQKGNVTITVDDEYTKEITNGEVSFEISNLNVDKYSVTVVFQENRIYSSNTNGTVFWVNKAEMNPEVDGNDVSVLQNSSFTISNLPEDFSGFVKIEIDDETYYDGEFSDVIEIDKLLAGDKTAKVTFYGDENYEDTSVDVDFTVSRISIGIDAAIDDVVYPNNPEAIIQLSGPGNGTIKITIGENVFEDTIENGAKTLKLDGLSGGIKTALVEFISEDGYYENASTTVKFFIGQTNTALSVAVDDNEDIIVKVKEDATGNVTVIVNGEEHSVAIDNGRAVLSDVIFNEGNNSIVAFYDGDENYNPAYNRTVYELPVSEKMDSDLAIAVNDDVITVDVGENATGNVAVYVNGKEYTVPIVEGKAVLADIVFDEGNNTITAVYAGDDNYNPASNNTVYEVPIPKKVDPSLAIDVKDNSISVDVGKQATGNLSIYVNTEKFSVPIVNGKAVLDNVSFVVGNNSIVAVYDGDEKYNAGSNSTVYEVPDSQKVDPSLSIDVKENAVVVSINEDASGNITIIVNGAESTVPIKGGKAVLSGVEFNEGNNTVIAVYDGDDKYNPAYNATTHEVPVPETKNKTDILIDIGVKDDSIIITVPENATGNIAVSVNGKKSSVPIKDGKATLNNVELLEGENTIVAVYGGDENYNGADVIFTFNKTGNETPVVKNKTDIDVNINVENNTIIVDVAENATGNVTLYVNGEKSILPINDGKAVLDDAPLIYGNNTIIAIYEGDDNYNGGYGDKTVEIKDDKSVIISTGDVIKYFSGPERFNVTVAYNNGTPVSGVEVKITINGRQYLRVTDENGVASLALNLNSGNYTAEVEVSDYNFTSRNVVEVLATIYATDVTKVFRNGTQYYGLFLDGEGNPLVNTEVSFNINGVFYKRTTNASGWARLNLNLEKGTYILTAINPATSEMRTNIVTVISQLQTSDLTKYYRNDSQFVVRVRADDGSWAGAGEVVKFNVHGRLYERTTNATGHAVLNINLEPEEYIITSYYKECREGNSIEVLPVLTASDLTMKYKDGSQFKAKLVDGQGKPYAGQKISFNINGVFYSRTTGSDGVAKLNINLQSGQYIITSEYNEYKISNTIKIGA